jgi:hypothetical protein
MSRTAEIAFARYNLLTPAQVAARLSDDKITDATVRGWIDAPNGLRAVDLRTKDATKPAWFIEWSWIEDFLTRRTKNAA